MNAIGLGGGGGKAGYLKEDGTLQSVDVQHPLPIDGDQVYEKDIDQGRSTSDGFTGGEIIDLVNNNYTILTNSSGTNPKVIHMELIRPLQSNIFGFSTPTGNFSNTKITATIGQGADTIEMVLLDESGNDTKKTTIIPEIAPVTLLSITIEFYTSDSCSVAALIISKSQQVIARIQAQKPNGTTTNINATAGGNLKTSLEELESGISSNNNKQLNVTQFDSNGHEIIVGRTAFDELHVAELTPIVQLQFPYNINTEQVDAHENNSGTVTQADNMAVLQSGTDAIARAELHSLVPVKYNPGQGGLVRFTSIFTTGVADSSQFVGVGDMADGYFFGYNGSSFGILKRRAGIPEIRVLIITAASQTAENITIELDGDSDATVAVTNQGADTAATRTGTANEIASHDFSNVGSGWGAVAEGASIVFVSFDSVSHSGAYSITASTAAGNYAQLVAGSAPAEDFVAQTSWGSDVMDGTGNSGITLDSTKGNVYQISYQWLGFGQICFFIENPATGDFVLVHRIEYANANLVPSVDNPTLPLSAIVINTGNTSNLTIKIGSMGGFIEGKEPDLGLLKSASVATVAVAATELPLISIKNKFDYQGKRNRVRVRINVVGISNDSKDIIVSAHLNPTLTAASFSDVSTNTSVMTVDTSATAISGGAEIFSVSLNKDESDNVSLKEYDFKLNPGDILTFTGISIAAGTTVTISVNWKELF